MKNLRQLTADADLEIIHDSGSRISVHLKTGEGVIELSDNRLIYVAVRNFRAQRQQWRDMAPYLQLVQQYRGRIELSVGGRRVARLDSSQRADLICRRLGLPYCRIRLFTLLLSLLRPPVQSHPD
jgi:hypothetical protein